MSDQIIDVPKGEDYPDGLGGVGDTGSLAYEVVAEDDEKCSIKITGVTPTEEAQNSGEALDTMMRKKINKAPVAYEEEE